MNLYSACAFASSLLLFACSSTGAEHSLPAESGPTGPQFYRVTGNGATAYLFGTVHLHDERTQKLPVAVDAAFKGSDSLYVEISPSPEERAEMRQAILLPEGTTLDQVVGDVTWKRMGDRYELSGQPRADLNDVKSMAPWVVMSEIPYLESRANNKPVLDVDFGRRARADDKPVRKLESVNEHLSLFTDMSLDEQATWFVSLLDKLDEYDVEGRSMTEETLAAWSSGEPARLYGLLDQILYPDMEDREGKEAKLLWIRNEKFAERLDRAMSESPDEVAFVAIGAMHLPTPPGVNAATEVDVPKPRRLGLADLMRSRGYNVVRLDAETGIGAGE